MNKLVWFVILIAIVVALLVGASITSSAADIAQAQANIEMARANQVLGRGLSDTTRMLSFILVVLTLTVVALLGVVIYLAFFRRVSAPPKPTWQPGPNARWGRKSLPSNVDPMQALLQLYLAEKLQSGAHPQQSAPQYTEIMVDEQEEISW